MAEVAIHHILAIVDCSKGVPRLIVGASPPYRKVDIFGYVATQRHTEGVADIIRLVDAKLVVCNIFEQLRL